MRRGGGTLRGRRGWIAALAGAFPLAAAGIALPAPPAGPAPEEFERRVRPLFARHCQGCHGPQRQMGGLRFDGRAGALKAGDSGEPAIVPGSAASSPLVRRVTSRKQGERMPPQGPPLTAEEVAALRAWIDAGAPWPEPKRAAPPAAAAAAARWWSFRPLRSVTPPAPRDARASRNPVDRFHRAALEQKGLAPAPPAPRRTLIRRLYFDLAGLPPPPEDVEAFLRDPDPAAYDRLVDRLLERPEFGERWGRRWLDVARYADSNGQEGDQDRPNAYHYRDFVIRAFNQDLPYDTFVRWQLAGDEIEPDNPLAVSATGFLTAGPHTVLNVPMEEEKIRNRYNELDDMLATTGAAFLGLTLGCARCHDHKFDPIPTRDYYRLLTAFNAGDRAEVPLLPRAAAAAWKEADRAWQRDRDAAQKALDAWTGQHLKPLAEQLRAAKIEGLPLDAAAKTLLRDAPADPRARELARRHADALKVEDRDYRPLLPTARLAEWDGLAAALRAVEARKPPAPPVALAMADFGPEPRPTWLLERGDLYLKKEPVQLGFPAALSRGRTAAEYLAAARGAGQRSDTTYHRRALAEWITDTRSGAGALLARVIVNRLWQHHFGEGLVRTVNDFGLQGEPPSHPELLEWLASELVRGGWKLKPLHRLILTSGAYRQGGAYDARKARLDPENRLLWRRPPLRIEAEIYRDAMLAASGSLNRRMFGPAFKAPIPAEAIQARNLRDPYPGNLKDGPETRRRTVYMFHKRVVQYPLTQLFDGPDATASCGRRSVTTVAPQALAVLNDPFVRLRAAEFARRLQAEAHGPGPQVDRAYRLALGRGPTREEMETSVRFLEEQTARRAAREPADGEREARLLALADFAQALFGLNEFLYVD